MNECSIYKELFNKSKSGICIIDKNFNKYNCNEKFLSILKVKKYDDIGLSFLKLLFQKYKKKDEFILTINTEEKLKMGLNKSKLTEKTIIKVSASEIEYNKSNFYIFCISDTTNEYLKGKNYNSLNHLIMNIFYNAPIGIVMLSVDGVFLDINKEYESFTMFKRNELLGKNLTDYILPIDIKKINEELKKIVNNRNEEIKDLELRSFKKDTTTIYLNFNAKVYTDNNNDILFILAFISDYTEIVNSQQMQRAVASNLSLLKKSIVQFDKIVSESFVRISKHTNDHLFNDKEMFIINCIRRGLSNKEIAYESELSESSIKKYISRIYNKTKVSSRYELLIYLNQFM